MKHKITSLLFAALLAVGLAGCSDELEVDAGGELDGTPCEFSAAVTFDEEVSQLGTRTAGDVIQKINDICVLVYSEDRKLYKAFYGAEIPNLRIEQGVDNREDDEGYLHDTRTGKATFNLTLPRARWYIFAVANMGYIAQNPKYDVTTVDKLREVQLQWDPNTISKNNQLFGIFRNDNNREDDDTPVALSRPGITLNCWLKRAASKVTVAFDGTDLYEGVQIFIDSVMIRDIPRTCFLGKPNEVGKDAAPNGDDRSKLLYEKGEIRKVQDLGNIGIGLTPEQYYHVCSDAHRYGGKGSDADAKDPITIDKAHAHTANSFFFFENVQGTGKSKVQSKYGEVIDYPDPVEGQLGSGWKDDKPYGTYVEVTGVYRSTKTTSFGRIKYRFMLGKNVTTDYNAERNTHYKLTLRFRGNGNEADWHIEFKEEPGIYVVSPQYISYLYNKEMKMDVKVVGQLDAEGLKAEIIESSWKPWGDGSDAFPVPPTDNSYYYTGTVNNDGPWNSFLSLRKTHLTKIVVPGYENEPSWKIPISTKYNQTYFENNKLGHRNYTTQLAESDATNGEYALETTPGSSPSEDIHIFTVPMYTRAKELITKTGFSGNNPFREYPRHAKVKFSGTINGEYKETIVDVIQVRRVENPKGIWRSHDNADPFHVTLMRRPESGADKFVAFKSEGPWSAELVGNDKEHFTLETTTAGNAGDTERGQLIGGSSEHPVDFMVNFKSAIGEEETRCAYIRIRYHNYTCEHIIFLRQGYAPLALADGETKWCSFNVYQLDGTKVSSGGWRQGNYEPVLAKSPLEEGSLFRWNNVSAILQTNNDTYGWGVKPATLKAFKYNNLTKEESLTWSQLAGGNNAQWEFLNSSPYRMPTADDFRELLSNEDRQTIEKGYGVLYGDGATETSDIVSKAFGYVRGGDTANGMRGCFVYDSENGRNLFFPIGKSGYGRRKDKKSNNSYSNGERNGNDGVLRYGQRNERYDLCNDGASPTNIHYVPLFFDIHAGLGAIYWTDGNETANTAWDINYNTLGFEAYETAAVNISNAAQSDACFMRPVLKKKD